MLQLLEVSLEVTSSKGSGDQRLLDLVVPEKELFNNQIKVSYVTVYAVCSGEESSTI